MCVSLTPGPRTGARRGSPEITKVWRLGRGQLISESIPFQSSFLSNISTNCFKHVSGRNVIVYIWPATSIPLKLSLRFKLQVQWSHNKILNQNFAVKCLNTVFLVQQISISVDGEVLTFHFIGSIKSKENVWLTGILYKGSKPVAWLGYLSSERQEFSKHYEFNEVCFYEA